ncbi:MAG: LysM domain-containing protein [Polyangiaceae bacterium]
MTQHIVQPGECVASLAAKLGVTVDAVWQLPDNAALRERRSSPFMLRAGDVIALPEPRRSGQSVSPGGTHGFRGEAPRVSLQLKLLDQRAVTETAERQVEKQGRVTTIREPPPPDVRAGEALSGVPYRLVVGARTLEGVTDGEGVLREEVDARITQALLILHPDTDEERHLSLGIGHLDPPDETTGLAQRLTNLGFPCTPETVEGILEKYQASRDLEVTGELDQATRRRLVEESGG